MSTKEMSVLERFLYNRGVLIFICHPLSIMRVSGDVKSMYKHLVVDLSRVCSSKLLVSPIFQWSLTIVCSIGII